VDAGIDDGTEVGGRFDPLLAKIVAHGADRGEALARLVAALDSTLVLGLVTNLRFLRWLVRQPVVSAGDARIDTLGRIWPAAGLSEGAVPEAAWTAAARVLGGGGWRVNGPSAVRLATEDETRTVRTSPIGAEDDAQTLPAAVRDGDTVHVDVGGRSVAIEMAPPPEVGSAGRAALAAHHGAADATVTAPMPGAVLTVHVAVGARVEPGDPLVTLEAMKMVHVVAAPTGGTVAELLVASGSQVARGQRLAAIEAG
jgi:acetyl-CoA/propionyl-CoA carboxylase biotin carboxyl carrier protein